MLPGTYHACLRRWPPVLAADGDQDILAGVSQVPDGLLKIIVGSVPGREITAGSGQAIVIIIRNQKADNDIGIRQVFDSV